MPKSQVAAQAVYDFNAPNTADAVIAWRVRNNQGGKVRLKFTRPVTTPDPAADSRTLTVSLQVAPLSAGAPGTFIATTAANNIAAVTNETITQQGIERSFEILLRPNVDAFLLVKASGGCRGQVIIDSDVGLDLWRSSGGLPAVTHV